MSITDSKRPKLKRDSAPDDHSAGRPLFRRPAVLAGAAVVAVALAVGGTVWAMHDGGGSSATPLPVRTAPITLPGTLSGLTEVPSDTNFANQPLWLAKAKTAAAGAVVVGSAYGSPQVRRQIRVVAGRTDLTGKLEFAWPADAGRTVSSPLGVAHCTQNLILAPGTPATVRPTMVFCSRISSGLSAYAAVIDFDHHPTDAVGMAALDPIWKAALTGR